MKINLNIPEKLSEMTLGQYQDWLKVSEGKELDTFLQQKIIEIFCGITLKEVMQIKASDIDRLVADISNIFVEEPKFIDRFDYAGKEFGFIPKLDDISFGEYVDLDTYLQDWQLMHKAMAVLFRPVIYKPKKKWYNFFIWKFIDKSKYLIEDYESAEKYDLKCMPLNVVFGSLVFFYHLRSELLRHILNYLANQTGIKVSPKLMDSLKNGVGTAPFMDLQKATF